MAQIKPEPLITTRTWHKDLYKLLDQLPDPIRPESAEQIVQFIEQLLARRLS